MCGELHLQYCELQIHGSIPRKQAKIKCITEYGERKIFPDSNSHQQY